MLRRDLTDIINSRRAWVFVGSGASIASGYPSWQKLLTSTHKKLGTDVKAAIRASGRYEKAMQHRDFIAAATHLEAAAGRPAFEAAFREVMTGDHAPNALTTLLADWPFEGYITSNYDGMLEDALHHIDGSGAWLSVGNSESEIRKVGRGPKKLVWHVHGSLAHDKVKSHLIITKRDYEQLYDEGSLFITQLKGLLAQKELVFIGFGFHDAELRRIIQSVGSLAPITKPIKAILPRSIGEDLIKDLFTHYNVDPILYDVGPNDSHDELSQLLRLHDPFILRRSQEYGKEHVQCDPYDEETTSVLIYNELTLKKRATAGADVLPRLLQSKVLAKLTARPSSFDELIAELKQLADDVSNSARDVPADLANAALQNLLDEGAIVVLPGGIVKLAPKGKDLVEGQRALAERERERFSESLRARVAAFGGEQFTPGQVTRISRIAEDFFADSVRRRAIGVANALYSERYQDFSLTTLLQSLPTFAGQSATIEEAAPLLHVIREVMLNPTEDERRVLGLMLQAQFAVHLLGFDPATVRQRLDELRNTLFIFDSHALMRYLARSAPGHEEVRRLYERLSELQATMMTTEQLVSEVVGHVGLALAHHRGSDPQTVKAYKDATGRGSFSNVFVAGYQTELANGDAARGFEYYVTEACRLPIKKRGDAAHVVSNVLIGDRINILSLRGFDGYRGEMAHELEQNAARLTSRRRDANTFKGAWQTDAESEVLVIVRYVRTGKLKVDGRAFTNAFFISPTSIMSRVSTEKRVTIRIEPLLQTIGMLTGWSLEEMPVLADSIFAEVTDRNLIVLAPERIEHVFHPLHVSSRRQIKVVLAQYQDLFADRMGHDELERISNYAGPDLPLLAERLTTQALDSMKRRIDYLSQLAESGDKALTKKERVEFERLKNKTRAKGRKNVARRQANRRTPPRTTT